jgi:hypothetical protein
LAQRRLRHSFARERESKVSTSRKQNADLDNHTFYFTVRACATNVSTGQPPSQQKDKSREALNTPERQYQQCIGGWYKTSPNDVAIPLEAKAVPRTGVPLTITVSSNRKVQDPSTVSAKVITPSKISGQK